jgi:hypothetical protein
MEEKFKSVSITNVLFELVIMEMRQEKNGYKKKNNVHRELTLHCQMWQCPSARPAKGLFRWCWRIAHYQSLSFLRIEFLIKNSSNQNKVLLIGVILCSIINN